MTPRISVLAKTENFYTGSVITTFLLTGFPWRLLCEYSKHSQVKANTESSRARPTASVIGQILLDPYVPEWTAKNKGMQGDLASIEQTLRAESNWSQFRGIGVNFAREASTDDIHKQDANSFLLPWMRVSMITTATHNEWLHFFELRCHKDTKRCFSLWAQQMEKIYWATPSTKRIMHQIYPTLLPLAQCAKIGSISYANHTKDRTEDQWLELGQDMFLAKPAHISPFQHISFAVEADGSVRPPFRSNDDPDLTCFAMDYHGDPRANLDKWHPFCEKYGQRPVASTGPYAGWVSIASMAEAVGNNLYPWLGINNAQT